MKKIRKIVSSVVIALALFSFTYSATNEQANNAENSSDKAWLGTWGDSGCENTDEMGCGGISGKNWSIEINWDIF